MEALYLELDICTGQRIKRRSSLVIIYTRLGDHHITNLKKLSQNFPDLLKQNQVEEFSENTLHLRRNINTD